MTVSPEADEDIRFADCEFTSVGLSSDAVELQGSPALEAGVEKRLRFLLESVDSLSLPSTLLVSDAHWGQMSLEDVELKFMSDGSVTFEVDRLNVPDATDDRSAFTAESIHGPLKTGETWLEGYSGEFGKTKSRLMAVFRAFTWAAVSDGGGWWGARLVFQGGKVPLIWERMNGNVLLRAAHGPQRLWCFRLTGDRRAFLSCGPRGQWFVLYQAENGLVLQHEDVHRLMLAVSFVLGTRMSTELFFQLGDECEITGIQRLDLPVVEGRASAQPPALPFLVEVHWLVEFVELAIKFMAAENGASLRVAFVSNLFSAGGIIESRILQNWTAAEVLANGLLARSPSSDRSLLVTDMAQWKAFVNRSRAELTGLARPSYAKRLYLGVKRACFGHEHGKVARAFEALGLRWTEDMDAVRKLRNRAAHEGTVGPIENGTLMSLGLLETMLAALTAKTIGYEGPLADRSRTRFGQTRDEQPPWWPRYRRPLNLVDDSSG